MQIGISFYATFSLRLICFVIGSFCLFSPVCSLKFVHCLFVWLISDKVLTFFVYLFGM